METYATALTAVLFFVLGYLTCYLFSEEVKDVIRRHFVSSKERQSAKEMRQAVTLVKEELGAEVIYDSRTD